MLNSCRREIAIVADILRRSGARDVRQAKSAEESEALWEARRQHQPGDRPAGAQQARRGYHRAAQPHPGDGRPAA